MLAVRAAASDSVDGWNHAVVTSTPGRAKPQMSAVAGARCSTMWSPKALERRSAAPVDAPAGQVASDDGGATRLCRLIGIERALRCVEINRRSAIFYARGVIVGDACSYGAGLV